MSCFNEAGGFLPRKHLTQYGYALPNPGHCFNEAGGFLPRKPYRGVFHRKTCCTCFNEAGGFLPRKRLRAGRLPSGGSASMRPGDFSPGNLDAHLEVEYMVAELVLQ